MRGAIVCLCAVLAGVVSAGRAAEPVEPKFTFKIDRERDTVRHIPATDGATFEIVSLGRAGRAEVKLTEGAWPADLTVRFKDFRAAIGEFSLTVSNGAVELHGSLHYDANQSTTTRRVYTNPTVRWFDAKGNPLVELSSRAKYAMTVQHDEKQGAMRVVLPPHFCGKDTKSLRLHWINAFE